MAGKPRGWAGDGSGSGGARPGAGGARPGSGGARPGAGRKPSIGPSTHKAKPVRISEEDLPCYVYVIYETDTPTICKIGVASDVVKRLATLQVGTWRTLKVAHAVQLPTKSAAHAIERQVHQSISALHCRGEWFSVSPDRAASEVKLAVDQLQAVFDAAARFTASTGAM